MTVFISKFVRLDGMLLFKNKHICLAIYGPQCESLMGHLQVRMNEAEMLYFHSKLPDPARGTNLEHLGMFSCCVGLQNKMHMFRE